MAKTRSTAATQALPEKTRSRRQALKEKTNTSQSQVPLYEDDGNTEDLVKNANPRRGQPRRIVPPELDLVMTGGLGLEEASSEGNGRQVISITEAAASERPIDPKMAPTTLKGSRRQRATRKIIPSSSQQEVLAGMKERMENTARVERSQQATKASGLMDTINTQGGPIRSIVPTIAPSSDSISPSPPRLGRNSLAHAARSSIMPPGSALKVHGTPAMESSLLALRNFKRRPRQPSMLQMVQQRTASARNSAAHVAADESLSDLDFDLSDLGGAEDFAPDAEGTPVKTIGPVRTSVGRNRTSPSERNTMFEVKSAANARKRKSDDMGSSSALLRSKQEKRQRSSSAVMLSSFATAPERTVSPDDSVLDRIRLSPTDPATNVEVIHSSPPSSPPIDSVSPVQRADMPASDVLVASSWRSLGRRKHSTPDVVDLHDVDGTFADPVSSSPIPEHQRESGKTGDPTGPIARLSPKPKRPRGNRAGKEGLSTAQLQTLLPRRRKHLEPRPRKTTHYLESDSDAEMVLDSSNLDDDEDELNANLPSKRRASTVPKKSRQRRTTKAAKKTSITPKRKSAIPSLQKKMSRTYGKKNASDKENDDGNDPPFEDAEDSTVPDVSLTMQEASKSNELEEAKRKFAQVDDWDMDFESFSAEDHRSSSFGWR